MGSLTGQNYMAIGVFLRVFIGCITIIGDVIVRTLISHFMSDQACTRLGAYVAALIRLNWCKVW
jgi:hypothetical protein